MSKVERFEHLKCWQSARELVRSVFLASEQGKLSKDFETRSQIKRAALETMNNIAEGFGRKSNKEFIRFLDISQSSSMEVKSITYALEDMEYLSIDLYGNPIKRRRNKKYYIRFNPIPIKEG